MNKKIGTFTGLGLLFIFMIFSGQNVCNPSSNDPEYVSFTSDLFADPKEGCAPLAVNITAKINQEKFRINKVEINFGTTTEDLTSKIVEKTENNVTFCELTHQVLYPHPGEYEIKLIVTGKSFAEKIYFQSTQSGTNTQKITVKDCGTTTGGNTGGTTGGNTGGTTGETTTDTTHSKGATCRSCHPSDCYGTTNADCLISGCHSSIQ